MQSESKSKSEINYVNDLIQFVHEQYAYLPNLQTFKSVVSSRLLLHELQMIKEHLNNMNGHKENKDKDILMQKKQIAEQLYIYIMLQQHYSCTESIVRTCTHTCTE